MHEATDIRLAGHDRDYISCDIGRFKGAKSDAAVWREGGERVQELWKALPIRGVKRKVAASDDDFVVADVDEAFCLVESGIEIHGRRLAPELWNYAERAFSGAAVLHLEICASRPRGDGRAALRVSKGDMWLGRGDFRGASGRDAAFDQKPCVWILLSDVRDELFAVALGASRHRAAADYYDIGVRMFVCKFPSASEILGLLLKRLRAVQPAAERIKANFHGGNYTIFLVAYEAMTRAGKIRYGIIFAHDT